MEIHPTHREMGWSEYNKTGGDSFSEAEKTILTACVRSPNVEETDVYNKAQDPPDMTSKYA